MFQFGCAGSASALYFTVVLLITFDGHSPLVFVESTWPACAFGHANRRRSFSPSATGHRQDQHCERDARKTDMSNRQAHLLTPTALSRWILYLCRLS